ncbi:MAG: hypothetical protein NVS1B4_20460 [Gemmatimonadaceae bacterium]
MDPILSFPVSEPSADIIAPASTMTLPTTRIDGYRGGASVRFLVYYVEGSSAVLRGVVTRSGPELSEGGYRVEILPK